MSVGLPVGFEVDVFILNWQECVRVVPATVANSATRLARKARSVLIASKRVRVRRRTRILVIR